MSSHAILSPSGAARWLACPPSARLELSFPDTAGEAAAEGTLAHALGEALLRRAMAGNRSEKIMQTKEIAQLENDKLYNPAMRGYAEDYATYVMEQYGVVRARTPDAVIAVEQRLDLSEYVPEGFGTGDAVITADGLLTIIDFKYGKGVPVFSEENPQMKLYALGALSEFGFLYGIDRVRMTIYQPRIDNTSSWEISVQELYSWAEAEVKPRAKMAYEGEGVFTPGEHCRFCRAKTLCKANADKNLELAKHDFADAALLTDDAVTDILSRADAFKKWITSVEEYALSQAVNDGKLWPGYKLVAGRSTRMFSDQDKVAETLIAGGIDESALYDRKMVSLTTIETILGKKEFSEKLSALIIKSPSKPALVPESDKRPALDSAEGAKLDFSN